MKNIWIIDNEGLYEDLGTKLCGYLIWSKSSTFQASKPF